MEHKTFSSSFFGTRDSPAFMGLTYQETDNEHINKTGWGQIATEEPCVGADSWGRTVWGANVWGVRWIMLQGSQVRCWRRNVTTESNGKGRGRQALCLKHSKEEMGLRGAVSDTAEPWTPRWELAYRLKWEANWMSWAREWPDITFRDYAGFYE